VTFSPDGKLLAMGTMGNIVRVMDAATGKDLIRHMGNGRYTTAAFQGNLSIVIAAITSANEIEISHISIDPAELIRDACSRLPRNLTREEWNQYLPGEPYRATCPNLPPER